MNEDQEDMRAFMAVVLLAAKIIRGEEHDVHDAVALTDELIRELAK